MKLPVRSLGRLVGALLLCVQGLAFASPHYLYSFLGGDEIVPTDLNDHGVVVMSGNSNVVPGGGSWLVGDRGDWTTATQVRGFGFGDSPYGGVGVSDINNAGHLFGSALRNGFWVPTIWIGGVPYDLTEPGNLGLTFIPDHGPKWMDIDPWLLEIPGLPFNALPGDRIHDVRALTNLRGGFVVAHDYLHGFVNAWGAVNTSYALLTRVPEPSSGLLVIAAMGCLLLTGSAASWRGVGWDRART